MKVMLTVLYLTIGINGFPLVMSTCMDDLSSFTVEDMEKIAYAVANAKGISPIALLKGILRKAKKLERVKSRTSLEEMALQELINSRSRPPSPGMVNIRPIIPAEQPLSPSRPIAPPMVQNSMFAGVFFPQGLPPQAVQSPQPCPPPLLIPIHTRPPPDVTIRVLGTRTIPEVKVTLSPMMTIMEALKQAESQFKLFLGPLESSNDIISFSSSPIYRCIIIKRFENVRSREPESFWKITVVDKDGGVIYDNVCIPSRSQVPVKPGMTITLIYMTM